MIDQEGSVLGAAEKVLDLEKCGAYFKGKCPGCGSNSFTISPSKNIYYCFGCHIGGQGERDLKAIVLDKDFEPKKPKKSFIADNWTDIAMDMKGLIFAAKKTGDSNRTKAILDAFLVLKREVENQKE